MKRPIRARQFVAAGLFVLALVAFFFVSEAVFLPKRHDYGATWGSFLQEEPDSIDVLFFGSSLSYCDIAPGVIWAQSGITSYVMAGPEQPPTITYHYLDEVYNTQSPKVAFVEVTGAFFDLHMGFTKVNIGYMPWGSARLAATFQAAEQEERLGLLFPLYNYHDRWSTLTDGDYYYGLLGYPQDPLAGYTYLDRVATLDGIGTRPVTFSQETYDTHVQALRDLAELAAAHDTHVIFYLSPSYWRLEAQYVTMLQADLDGVHGAQFLDLNADFDALGLDPTTDFYDYMHLNVWGAQQFSIWLADYLQALPIDYQAPDDPALWQLRADHFAERLHASAAARAAQS